MKTKTKLKREKNENDNNADNSSVKAALRRLADCAPETLHWLPVQQRIDNKVALLTFNVRSTSTPSYLHRLLQDREGVHNLRRRSATPALRRPFTKTTIAKRAFRRTAPAIWNSLPKTVLDSGAYHY